MPHYNAVLRSYADDKQQLRIFSEPIHENDDVAESRTVARLEHQKLRASNPDYVRSDKQIERSNRQSKNRTVNTIYELARANKWDYFVTLTFDPKLLMKKYGVDNSDYSLVSKLVGTWLHNLRRTCPDLVYLAVPELHKDGKKWHIHALFGIAKGLPLVDSGRRKRGHVIYNIGNYHLGFSTATKVTHNFAVCSYITKYITKDLVVETKHRKRVWVSHNIKRPEVQKFTVPRYALDKLMEKIASGMLHAKVTGDELYSIHYIELEGMPDVYIDYVWYDAAYNPFDDEDFVDVA